MRTLGTIWCDEAYAFESWNHALASLSLDRSQWHLLILNRGKDRELAKAISMVAQREDLRESNRWATVEFLNEPQDVGPRYELIAQAWQRLNELRPRGTDLLGWEADTVPFHDSAERLCEALDRFNDSDCVTSVQYDRHCDLPRMLLWKQETRSVFGPNDECKETVDVGQAIPMNIERGAGTSPAAASGTGFTLFRGSFLDGYTFGCRDKSAHDLQVGADLKKAGRPVRVIWDVKVKHKTPGGMVQSAMCRAREDFRGQIEQFSDTALIYTFYGQQPARIKAVNRALDRIMFTQEKLPRVLFLELLFPGEETAFPHMNPRIDHRIINAGEQHRYLMQKEALFNIGAEMTTAEHLIFADPDGYSLERDWFIRIREQLREHPDNLVQGFNGFVDTLELKLQAPAVATGRRGENGGWAPGFCWGINRGFFIRMKGWNPWCITGSGDRAFVREHFTEIYDQRFQVNKWFEWCLRRNQPKGRIGYVDTPIVHEWHGTTGQRAYRWSRYVIDLCGPVTDHVYIDGWGLLAWYDPDCFLRRCLARKPEMVTREAMEQIMAQERVGVRCINGFDFRRLRGENPYWAPRWEYMRQARLMAESVPAEAVLEIGTAGIQLCPGSTTMDVRDDGQTDYVHDAGEVPWCFEDDQFDLVIMLQVLEHLKGRQRPAWQEIRRVAKWAVVSVPYRWPKGSDPDHEDITKARMREWTGQRPKRQIVVGGQKHRRRLVQLYDLGGMV